MTRPKRTPWAKPKRTRAEAKEHAVRDNAIEAASIAAAGDAIDQRACPNGCGALRADDGCRCGFRLTVAPPAVVDPRSPYHRKPSSSSRHNGGA